MVKEGGQAKAPTVHTDSRGPRGRDVSVWLPARVLHFWHMDKYSQINKQVITKPPK